MEVIIIMATVIIMAIATVMEAMEIITRVDMAVIMADIMVMITLVALTITVLVVTVKVGVIKVVVTAVVATAERKDLCTIDLCTILWFMELKATMVKDSRHLPNMQPWDLGHIVEPVVGEDF